MSYPGYPGGYQHAPGGNSGPPYEQQQYGGSAPYPPYPSGNAPYPQGGVFPPSLGYQTNAPMYMPQPAYGGAPGGGYPPQYGGGGYPSQGPPPSSGGYPSPPTSGGGYPPQGPPASGGGYSPQGPPASSGGYPPAAGGGYPPQGPPASGGGYPPQGPPASGGAYPSQNPPSGGGYAYGGAGGAPGASYGSGSYGGGCAPPHGGSYPTGPSSQCCGPKYTPTVRPMQPFDPRGDAEILRKAMKGFGTDEKSIINVLGRRTNSQRLEIAVQFKTLYGKDLIKDLKSETSGNFENLLVALMTPLPQFYAKELHDAISGIGTDETVLIEVLCTMTNHEIQTIRAAYQGLYYRSLEEDLRGDTAGTFKRLMTSLCNAGRDESMRVDPSGATADAQALLQAGELRMGTDESTFNMIMCQRNYVQLAAVFDEYQRITGHDIEKAVKNEFSGDAEDGLLAIIRSVRNRPAFFAKKINESMKGMGTDDRQLIRLIATRCEIDMEDIKRYYTSKYGAALKDDIEGDTSGHYKKLLWALIGEY